MTSTVEERPAHGDRVVSVTRAMLRVLAVLVGSGLLVWGWFMSLNAVLLHGLAANCSDGHPEYDPQYCGVTWTPGLPYILAAVAGVVMILVAARQRAFTGVVLVAAGSGAVLVATVLTLGWTWFPANPSYPEPVGPQAVLLAVGVAALLAGVLRLRGAGSHAGAAPG